MNNLNALILLALIKGIIASDAIAVQSDDLNVMQVLADNNVAVSRNEANEVNTPPLFENSKQTRINVTHTRIAALPDSSASKEKSALNKVLKQFVDLKIPSSRNLQKAAVEITAPEPNIAESQPSETLLPGQIDAKTLEQLAASAKDPNTIAEPLALAQTLYRAGYFKGAALFYEIAMCRTKAMGRVLTSDDKAWILLQLAACNRDAPQTAIGVLDKLIAAYPKSIWTSAAVTKRDILQWYQKDNPRQLLETPR